jgi:hypothetical protein
LFKKDKGVTMGHYNFDQVIDRHHTKSLKVDFALRRGRPQDVQPFWVADMDFPVADPIKEALHKVVDHGIWGYTETEEEYIGAIAAWMTKQYGWTPKEEWLIKTPGVVFALAMTVQAFTKPGDGVLLMQPVYYPFSEVIEDNGRHIVNVPMIRGQEAYGIDFDAIERRLSKGDIKLFLLCSPANPVGRVWTVDELTRLGDICNRYGVLVVADEIHADFIWPGHQHHTYPSLGPAYADNCILCTAPSKTFNIAGLQISNIFIPNDKIRQQFKAAVTAAGYSQANSFGIFACQAAYQHGEEWLKEVKAYIWDNILFTKAYLEEHLPQLKMYMPQGTYLVWIDCSALPMSARDREQWLWHDAKLWLDSGAIFGDDGVDFERINVACPRSVLKAGLDSLRNAVNRLK